LIILNSDEFLGDYDLGQYNGDWIEEDDGI